MSLYTSTKLFTLVLTFDENQEKILLGLKKRGFGVDKWNGFGGKVEKGETIEEGARRELMEECEIKAIDMKKVAINMFTFQDDPVALEVHIFVVKSFEGEARESEEMRPQWYLYDQIPFDQMWADDKHWFPFVLKKQQNFIGHFHFAQDSKTILHKTINVVNDSKELDQIDLKNWIKASYDDQQQ